MGAAMSSLTEEERKRLKQRIEQVLSEILTDKYGEEYGVKITVHFVPKEVKDVSEDKNQLY